MFPSQLNRARCSAGLLLRGHIGQKAMAERPFPAMATTTSPSSSWPCPSVRQFSVKNRKRKEEKRRQRQQEKKEESKEATPVVTTTPATPVVIQTKADDDDMPEHIKRLKEQGFTVEAAPPGDDDEVFVPRFAMPDKEKEKEITQLQTQVSALYKSGRYTQGLELAQDVLATTLEHFGSSHPATASSFLNVGLFQKQLGNFEKALEHYNQALKSYEETVGSDHESYALVLHNKGMLFQSRLHFDEELQATDRIRLVEQALESLEEAYKIRSVELPPEHPHVVASQSALGMTLTAHILSQHRRVSEDKKNVVPGAAGYRSVLPSQVTEESWWAAEGHLREALLKATQNPRGDSYLKRTDKNHYLNIQKKHNLKQKIKKGEYTDKVEFPVQTASAATASQNLAVFLKARSTTVDNYHPNYQKWVQEAQELYQTTLEVRTALLPKAHPDIYATQHSLAELYDYSGQEELAEEMREIILETYYDDEPPQQEKKKEQL